jgi:hypothetical protein
VFDRYHEWLAPTVPEILNNGTMNVLPYPGQCARKFAPEEQDINNQKK